MESSRLAERPRYIPEGSFPLPSWESGTGMCIRQDNITFCVLESVDVQKSFAEDPSLMLELVEEVMTQCCANPHSTSKEFAVDLPTHTARPTCLLGFLKKAVFPFLLGNDDKEEAPPLRIVFQKTNIGIMQRDNSHPRKIWLQFTQDFPNADAGEPLWDLLLQQVVTFFGNIRDIRFSPRLSTEASTFHSLLAVPTLKELCISDRHLTPLEVSNLIQALVSIPGNSIDKKRKLEDSQSEDKELLDSEMAPQSPSLQELRLVNVTMSSADFKSFCQMMEKNQTIEVLVIHKLAVSSGQQQHHDPSSTLDSLFDILQRNRQLGTFHFTAKENNPTTCEYQEQLYNILTHQNNAIYDLVLGDDTLPTEIQERLDINLCARYSDCTSKSVQELLNRFSTEIPDEGSHRNNALAKALLDLFSQKPELSVPSYRIKICRELDDHGDADWVLWPPIFAFLRAKVPLNMVAQLCDLCPNLKKTLEAPCSEKEDDHTMTTSAVEEAWNMSEDVYECLVQKQPDILDYHPHEYSSPFISFEGDHYFEDRPPPPLATYKRWFQLWPSPITFDVLLLKCEEFRDCGIVDETESMDCLRFLVENVPHNMRRFAGGGYGFESLDQIKMLFKALPRITDFSVCRSFCHSIFLQLAEELRKHGSMERLSLQYLPQFKEGEENNNDALQSAFVQILDRNNKLQYLKVELERDGIEPDELYEDDDEIEDEDVILPICSEENARAWLGAIRAGLEKNTCITQLLVSGHDYSQVLHARFYMMEPKIVYLVNLNRVGRGAIRCATPAEMIELILKVESRDLLGMKHIVCGESGSGYELYQQSLVFDLLLECTEKWCIAAAEGAMDGGGGIS